MSYKNKYSQNKIIGDKPCPSCRSMGRDSTGNHLILFEDGGAYCNRCEYTEPATSGTEDTPLIQTSSYTNTVDKLADIATYPVLAIEGRGVTAETAEYFGVQTECSMIDRSPVAVYFPRFSYNSTSADAFKRRSLQEKQFTIYGKTEKTQLFGQDKARGGKTLYITEGEYDALIVYQCLRELSSPDWRHLQPAVVSVPDGAGSASRAIADNLSFVNGFEKVVIVFDQDEPGKKATDEVCRLIGSKAYVAKLGTFKDPNEMYLAGRKKELKEAIVFNAEKYMPAGIATVMDLLDDACTLPTYGLSYPWPSLTDLTYGLHTGLLIGIAAGVGIGKTDWFSQLSAHLIEEHNEPIGLFKLEEPPSRSLKAIAGKIRGIPFHRPDIKFEDEELRSAIRSLDGKIYSYNHFGYKEWGSIKADIRVLRAYGVRYFIIDPLTALIAHEQDEHKALNEMMEDMASLTQELDITIFYSSHLNPPPRGAKSHEEGGEVKESQLYGSRAMIRWSHYIFGLQRNKHAKNEAGEPDFEQRNTTKFVLLKDREHGNTGQFLIKYDPDTTRYLEPKKVEEEVMF